MTPDQIAKALEDIVDMFTQEPWFYFVDKQQCYIAFYWEYILDQLSFIIWTSFRIWILVLGIFSANFGRAYWL